MKIMIDGIVREMTAEEETAFYTEHENLVPPDLPETLTHYANSITGADDLDLISAAETLIDKYSESKDKAEAYDILIGGVDRNG